MFMIMPTYPESPGYKGTAETSRNSAIQVKSAADIIRARVLSEFRGKKMSADECAQKLRPANMSDVAFETFKRSVRSRVSELKADGRLFQTKQRSENSSGHRAVVWSSTDKFFQPDLI
jgi:hypothetical protein